MDRNAHPDTPPSLLSPGVGSGSDGRQRHTHIRIDVPRPGADDELEQLRALVAHIQRMLVSLPAIEQAKGILIATEGCTAEDAFEMLRAASQRMNTPLRDVARRLVDRYERRGLLAHARESRDVSNRLVKDPQELMTPKQSGPRGGHHRDGGSSQLG